jgi:imidazolonepropionase-like amidohydrolase
LEAGVDSIEHGIFLDENGAVKFDPTVAERIVESGTFLNPSNAFAVRATMTGRTDEAGDFGPGLIAKLRADRVETWREQYAIGVKLIPGSDGGWYATPVDDYARIPQLMVSEIGMTPMEALRACTSLAAEAIGRGGDIGQLTPGSRADMIAVEGDPARDIEALWRVRWVMIGGSVVWPDSTLNEPRALE